MKHILLSLFLIALICNVEVNSQCSKLVRSYFNCKNNQASSANIFPDSFWQTQLSEYNENLEGANRLFKTIYTELKDCSTAECQCIRDGISTTYDYESYFLNADRTNDVNRVTNAVRGKYTLRSAEQVNNDPFSQPVIIFFLSTPSINDFCLNYDWSHESYYFYDEASLCLRKQNLTYYLKCVTDARPQLATASSLQAAEIELKCRVRSYHQCDKEMRHFIGLVELATSPEIIKGSLYDYSSYIAGLTGGSSRIEFAFLPLLISSLLYFIII